MLCKSPDVVKVRLSARVRAAGVAPVSPQIPIRRTRSPLSNFHAFRQTRHARDQKPLPLSHQLNSQSSQQPQAFNLFSASTPGQPCCLHSTQPQLATHSLTYSLPLHIQTVNMAISKKLKVHTPTPGVPSLAPPRWLYHLAGHQTYTDMFSDPTRAQEG